MEWDLNYNLTLDDTSVVRPTIWLMVGSIEVMDSLYRRLGLSLEHKPLVMLSPLTGNFLFSSLCHPNDHLTGKLSDRDGQKIYKIYKICKTGANNSRFISAEMGTIIYTKS